MPIDDFDDFDDVPPDASPPGRAFAEYMREGVKRVTHTGRLIQWHHVLSVPARAPQVLRFLADNVNPNRLMGNLRNLATVLTTGALNQNCVICAQAVDLSLEALVGRAFARDSPPADLWAAERTTRGDLQFLRNLPSDRVRPIPPNGELAGSLAEGILSRIRPGERAIIVVPVRDARYLHALNALHVHDGACFIVDGQCGKVYERRDRAAFDARFRWPETGRFGDLQAGVFVTGAAPDFSAARPTRPDPRTSPTRRLSFSR